MNILLTNMVYNIITSIHGYLQYYIINSKITVINNKW